MIHTLPGVHALHLVELAARWQVRADELLAPLGLDLESLAEPRARLSIQQVAKLAERAHALTGEPALGIYLGMSMRASAHGYLGFAAMSAATVGEALELAARFAPTRTSALALHLCVDGDAASLVLEERADLGAARELIVFSLLVGLWQLGRTLTGRELDGSANVAFAEPPWFRRFGGVVSVKFSQPLHQLVFPASTLNLPLVMADAAAMRLAREQCEQELSALGAGDTTAARVRRLLWRERGGFRDLPEVAKQLSVSTRTLKRRLSEEGVQFSQLLDEERRSHALLLLRSPLSLDEIAARLGYSDTANFTRAFRRWTGKAPGAFRRTA
jgi:AraC-like DNA-binding protein